MKIRNSLISLAFFMWAGCSDAPEVWFVDLLEDEGAVLIDRRGNRVEVAREALPEGVREGWAFVDSGARVGELPACGRGACEIDEETPRRLREDIARRRARLLENGADSVLQL